MSADTSLFDAHFQSGDAFSVSYDHEGGNLSLAHGFNIAFLALAAGKRGVEPPDPITAFWCYAQCYN